MLRRSAAMSAEAGRVHSRAARTRPWRAQTQAIGRLTGSRASNAERDFDANPAPPRYRPRVILDSAAARCGCRLRRCVLARAGPGRRAESDQVEPDVSGIPRVAGWNSSIDLLRVTRRVVAHWIRTVRTGVAKRFAIFLVSERAAVVRVVAARCQHSVTSCCQNGQRFGSFVARSSDAYRINRCAGSQNRRRDCEGGRVDLALVLVAAMSLVSREIRHV